MKSYHNYTLYKVIDELTLAIKQIEPHEKFSFGVTNPDLSVSIYNGSRLLRKGEEYIYRGYKTWVDLAHTLGCRMLTPQVLSEELVTITYEKLNLDVSFHTKDVSVEEKYGSESIFTQIHKNEEVSFLFYYKQALQNAKLQERKRVLNLGVNSGDEFEVMQKLLCKDDVKEFLGLDYCSSAIETANEKFQNDGRFSFLEADINRLNDLGIGKFDLIVSIGTLQSSNLSFNTTLMSIVQNQLKKDGAMILGFPNCRWIDGEMIYGARVKNYNFSEMGLLYKDVLFAKKYLQQKKFRVTLTGKDYIFLTATSIR